jgi:hypothetical protein
MSRKITASPRLLVFIVLAMIGASVTGHLHDKPIINSAILIFCVGYYSYSITKLQREQAQARSMLALNSKEISSFKNMLLYDIIPNLERLEGKAETGQHFEEEADTLLWTVHGIDYWGANYFWVEGHIFKYNTPRFMRNEYSICNIIENERLMENIGSLKKLLEQRNVLLQDNTWENRNSIHEIDMGIGDIGALCNIKQIGMASIRVQNYERTRSIPRC